MVNNLPVVHHLCWCCNCPWGSEYSKDLSSFSHTVHRVLSALSSADPARVNCLSKQVAGRGDWEKESKTWKMSPSGMCLKRLGGDWFVLNHRLDMKVLTFDRSKIVVRCSTTKEMDSEARWYMVYLIYMIPKAWEKTLPRNLKSYGLGSRFKYLDGPCSVIDRRKPATTYRKYVLSQGKMSFQDDWNNLFIYHFLIATYRHISEAIAISEP